MTLQDIENAFLRIFPSSPYGLIQPLYNTVLQAKGVTTQDIPAGTIYSFAYDPKTALQNAPSSIAGGIQEIGSSIGNFESSILQPLTIPLLIVGALVFMYLFKK